MSSQPKNPSDHTVFSHSNREGFEQIVFCYDKESGLKAIISIHSTKRGPSLGGSRFFPYATEEDALQDSLNLARAMTYKAAAADLPFGGGKAVIIGDPEKQKSPKLWKAYANFIQRLSGSYITTVDSGTSSQDMDLIRQDTQYVVGMSPDHGGSGDPSPTTALGVAEGIRACAQFVFGNDSLVGKRIAVQGIGHVGFPLAVRLRKMGASLIVTDKNEAALQKASQELGAEVVGANEIFSVKCDIFAPCAMGGAITPETLSKLKCAILAGAANNPLASKEIGEQLHQKGIVYAPDYVINAGGLIHVTSEWNGFDAKDVEQKTLKIYDSILTILKRSKEENRSTAQVAQQIAEERLR